MKSNFSLFIILVTIFLLLFLESILDVLSLELFIGYKQVIMILSGFIIILLNLKNFTIPKNLRFVLIFFFAFLLLNFLTNNILFSKYLFGLISTLLFSYVFIVFLNVKFTFSSIYIILIFLLVLLLVSTIYTLSSLFYSTDLREQLTIFRELGFYGCVTSFGVIISLSLSLKEKNKIFVFIALFFSFSVFLTVLKKSIIDIIFIWFIYFFYNFKINSRIFLICIISFVLILTFPLYSKPLIDNINENIDYFNSTKEDGVRIIMYFTAFNLANNYFPFGSGLGTFGSPASVFGGDYSNIYYNTGIANIPEMSPEYVMNGKPHTLFDTFWPHIIGELGYVGLLIFLILWFYPINLMNKIKKQRNSNNYKFIYFYIISTYVLITLDGFTLFLPEQPAIIIFYSLIPAVLIKYLINEEKA